MNRNQLRRAQGFSLPWALPFLFGAAAPKTLERKLEVSGH
jgi:hypothetical protein